MSYLDTTPREGRLIKANKKCVPPQFCVVAHGHIPGCCCSSYWAGMTPLGAWVLVNARALALGPQEGLDFRLVCGIGIGYPPKIFIFIRALNAKYQQVILL